MLFTFGCSGNDQGDKASTTQAKPNAAAQQKGSFISIPPQEAGKLINSRKDLLLIDVRNPQELREGSISGSSLVPFVAVMRGQHALPKDRPILLICAVGGRSYAAGQVLIRQGYKQLYNLSGGIDAWKKAGLPLTYQSM